MKIPPFIFSLTFIIQLLAAAAKTLMPFISCHFQCLPGCKNSLSNNTNNPWGAVIMLYYAVTLLHWPFGSNCIPTLSSFSIPWLHIFQSPRLHTTNYKQSLYFIQVRWPWWPVEISGMLAKYCHIKIFSCVWISWNIHIKAFQYIYLGASNKATLGFKTTEHVKVLVTSLIFFLTFFTAHE